jgi:membrane-associated phospholipid phosphatase
VRSRRREGALALVLAAGGVLFVVMWLLERHGEPGLDRAAFDVLATTPRGLLVRLANSWLRPAATYTILAGLLVAIAMLARSRRWLDAATIVAGSVAVVLATALAKGAFTRPRPPDQLMLPVGGPAFPSSHAAYSTALVAVALVLAGRVRSRPRSVALVGAAALAAALIGVWLVAVRVHYLTDVLAGWGLGAALFALSALALERLADGAPAGPP